MLEPRVRVETTIPSFDHENSTGSGSADWATLMMNVQPIRFIVAFARFL